ncbi:26S proteasome non-ATPase regulatory subunit 5 [Latimeria chalumnae]|uniref:26S proteasome non-ATPase regulatory subunit 5 n=1 Tax=Latimeria chalumnae TaxID=7897 RepID=UPI00313BF277
MATSIEELLFEISGLEELNSLKTAVLAVPLSTLKERTPGLRLGVLFSLLNTNDREQINLCVSILDRFLQALEPMYLAQNFREELQRGLFHPDDSVKTLAISQVGRIVDNSEAMTAVLNNPEFLRQIIQCIGDEKISVAKEAIKSLSKIAQTKAGLEVLFMSNLLQDLKDVMAKSDIIRYRVYELIVEISSMSPISLGYCINSGVLSQLIGELTGDDILVRATCIEMVTTLAHSQHGRQYLAQQGIIDKISNMMIGADSDPFSSFYLPGLVKFFGNLAVVDSPQYICEQYPAFVEKVFEMAEGQDQTMIGVALDTLGVLGSNIEGKQVLQKTGGKFQSVLKKMGHVAKSAPTDLRLRSLDAIASILSLLPDQQTEDLLGMTESWFNSLSSKPMELFQSISTQPFPELHCSALKVFIAIASQTWGQKLMINTPGFVEYVVDRSVDPDKDSKDAKFELVKTLVNSKTIAEVFGNQHYLRLRSYLREGPYYIKAVSTVAVEGAE